MEMWNGGIQIRWVMRDRVGVFPSSPLHPFEDEDDDEDEDE